MLFLEEAVAEIAAPTLFDAIAENRLSDAWAACFTYLGEPSTYQVPLPGRRCSPLVGTITCAMSPPQEAIARAMSDSLCPRRRRAGGRHLRCRTTATHHFTALRQVGVLHQYYNGTSRMNVLRVEEMERVYPGFLPAVISGSTTGR